jgi:hypothetical protein
MTTNTSKIASATRRDETILRLGGNGDNWHMSWAADDSQVVSLCDGSGLPGTTQGNYNSRLFRIFDGPENARFADVPSYPELLSEPTPGGSNRYYCFGTIAIDGAIYQYLSTPTTPFAESGARFVGAKLIYSPDDGLTWCNQDGSTPVVWEPWQERSRENMVFFEESQESFQLLSVLQMGKNHSESKDGYVYVYAPNGNTEGTMNELVMFRVPRDKILDRGAYEYFASARGDGGASWTTDIEARGVVHTFPRGWVNTSVHPYSWHPSLTYNAPLGLYLMANWGMGCSDDGMWFGKPTYLGLWSAPAPWGPWEQFHEETAWTPGGDQKARAYQPQIAPKWIAPDGKSFWLVWTDFQPSGDGEGDRPMPYYAFNVQRVDLDVR